MILSKSLYFRSMSYVVCKLAFVCAALFIVCVVPSEGMAQTPGKGMPPQRYSITPFLQEPFLIVQGSDLSDLLRVDLSFGFQYLRNPYHLYLLDDPEFDQIPVRDHIQFRPGVTFAFRKWFAVGLVIPFAYQTAGGGDPIVPVSGLDGVHLLDGEFFLKVPFLHNRPKGFGLGLSGQVFIPWASSEAFVNEGYARGTVLLMADWKYKGLTIALNFGALARKEHRTLDTDVGSEWLIRPGISYVFSLDKVRLGLALEADFATAIDSFFTVENVEARQFIFSFQLLPPERKSGFSLAVGGGTRYLGDDGGYSVPDGHIDARFGYSFIWGEKAAPPGPPVVEARQCGDEPVYTFSCKNCEVLNGVVWDFGDGERIEGTAEVVHHFKAPGDYRVVLARDGKTLNSTPVKVRSEPLVISNVTCAVDVSARAGAEDAGASLNCKLDTNRPITDGMTTWFWPDASTSGGLVGNHMITRSGNQPVRVELSLPECGVASHFETYIDVPQPARTLVATAGFQFDCPDRSDVRRNDDKRSGVLCGDGIKLTQEEISTLNRLLVDLKNSPDSRLIVVGSSDRCYCNESSKGDRYNQELSQRRVDMMVITLRQALGAEGQHVEVYTAALGRLCSAPTCACGNFDASPCPEDRKVRVYIDRTKDTGFTCPNGVTVEYRKTSQTSEESR